MVSEVFFSLDVPKNRWSDGQAQRLTVGSDDSWTLNLNRHLGRKDLEVEVGWISGFMKFPKGLPKY